MNNWKELCTKVINSLSKKEREQSIVYIEQCIIPEKQEVPWPGIMKSFAQPVILVFIDLEPPLNWAHKGRYLVLDVDGTILQKIEVDFPPFLTEVSPHLRLLHKGEQAPEWALATTTNVL